MCICPLMCVFSSMCVCVCAHCAGGTAAACVVVALERLLWTAEMMRTCRRHCAD